MDGFGRYLRRLLTVGKDPNAIVTRFALKKAINKAGITYSQVTFTEGRDLLPENSPLCVGSPPKYKRTAHPAISMPMMPMPPMSTLSPIMIPKPVKFCRLIPSLLNKPSVCLQPGAFRLLAIRSEEGVG